MLSLSFTIQNTHFYTKRQCKQNTQRTKLNSYFLKHLKSLVLVEFNLTFKIENLNLELKA